jgi:hypothetical protein
MLEKDFDQLIRDQFEDHSSPVPADMWQRIEGKDDKDRKAFFFWKWYFLGPAFLALSVVGGQLLFHHTSSSHPAIPVAPAKIAAPTIPIAPAAPAVSAKTATPAKTATAAGSAIPSATATGSATPGSAIPASNGGARPRLKSMQNAYSPASNGGARPREQSSQNANFPTTLANPAAPAKTAPSVGSNSAASATPATANRAIASSNSAPPTAAPTATPPASALASTQSAPHQPSDRPSPPPMLPATAGTHQPQSLSCPDPSKKFTRGKGWYLEALGSPDYPIVHSSLDGSSIQELPLLSYTIGIRVTKIFESGFLMTAGLQYSWINLRNQYDSLPLPHQFRSLDLPLLIGYEKGNDLFKVGIRGGVIFNIHSWPGSSDPYISEYFKSNTGISSYIGLELIRQVNDRISIFAEPYYRHQFSDMLKNPFVEKIDVAGIFLGLRFTLKSSNQ